MREQIEGTFALATATLGAITATHGLLSGNTNATIVGAACLILGVLGMELISIRESIQKTGAAIVASLISEKFRKGLNDDVEDGIKKARKAAAKKTEKKHD